MVAYVRHFKDQTKRCHSKLIYAASIVAPTKGKLSIPKKELNAVVMACLKAAYLSGVLQIDSKNIYIHSDSLVAMFWIKHDAYKLKVYVSNRVRKIQEHKFKLLYINGSINPAELVSKKRQQIDM